MPDRPAIPAWPRGLEEELAAAYVGLAPSTFRREVTAGRAPAGVRITVRRLVWLREDLDHWLDAKAGRAPASPTAELTDEWDLASRDGAREPALPANL